MQNHLPPALPECVIVDFATSYCGGPFFPEDESKRGWVPIFPETSEWSSLKDNEMISNSRSMIPLRLCYAWTIWKAQGQTASGLDSHHFYAKGAFVLLIQNVWQSAGLCNGATGKVIDIVY